MTDSRPVRPGPASLALLLILAITAGWWALALWPAGAVEPEWLIRTRAACFGAMPGGLPDAGGWILLIGEPLGMLGALFVVWGGALRRELRLLGGDRRWRWAMVAVGGSAVLGIAATGRRLANAEGWWSEPFAVASGTPTAVDIDASPLVLIDQSGRRASLGDFRGGPSLLTFGFGHCTTVCPTIVHDLRAARVAARRPEVPLLVISLDPWRDTPASLPAMAAAWELDPGDRVFSGSVAEVERALDALGVGRTRDGTNGDITHAGTVMVLDARGHVVWRVDGGWGRAGQLLASVPR